MKISVRPSKEWRGGWAFTKPSSLPADRATICTDAAPIGSYPQPAFVRREKM
jgi:hypothetical protein